MRTLAIWCHRHRFAVLGSWLLLLVLLAGAGQLAGRSFTDGFSLPGTDSTQAQQLLAGSSLSSGSGDDTVVVHSLDPGVLVTDPAIRAQVEAVLAAAARQPLIAAVRSPYGAAGRTQVSPDGRIAYAGVSFTEPDQNLTKADIAAFVATVTAIRGPHLQVELGGGAFQTLKGSPLSGSVAIGLLAAAVVLLLAFGSLSAAAVPLLAAVLAVGAGIQTIGLLSHAIPINSLSPSVAALIGIGVAVDYALLVVTRHRIGLRTGLSSQDAAATAIATSGRAVVFAGSTVAVAMLGLLLLGVDFLTGVGVAAAVTVLFAVAAANTLLPALFGLLGVRVLSRRERRRLAASSAAGDPGSGFWTWCAALVQRRPAALSLAALAVIAVLVVPAFSITLGSSDQGNDPSASTTRKAYDLLADGFGAGFNGPLLVVGQTGDRAAAHAFDQLAGTIRATGGVASVTSAPRPPGGTLGVLAVTPTTSPQSDRTTKLIDQLRLDVIPAAEQGTALRAYVGGQTAVFEDFAHVLTSKLPVFLGVIVLVGCLLLMLAFRSIAIPLTAAVMNVLAAAATFGVVVAIFQWGWGANAIGLGKPGPIESFLPVMLIAILFGLSMDYQVFLVSRIHEEWVRDGDTARAIRAGQAQTGRVITAAAAIMVIVFLAFVLEGRRPIGEFGLGLAAAIVLDALLLRTILVPAAMHLLGERNWWLPAWLDRALPRIPIDGIDEPDPSTTAIPGNTSRPPTPRDDGRKIGQPGNMV